jgi:hypothetical protein
MILVYLLNLPSNVIKTTKVYTDNKEFASIPPVPAPKQKPPKE